MFLFSCNNISLQLYTVMMVAMIYTHTDADISTTSVGGTASPSSILHVPHLQKKVGQSMALTFIMSCIEIDLCSGVE